MWNLHKPIKRVISLVLNQNDTIELQTTHVIRFTMVQPWGLEGTILFPISYLVNDSRDYIKGAQIPKTLKWEWESQITKLWALPLGVFMNFLWILILNLSKTML
jgi:hypothetical protein